MAKKLKIFSPAAGYTVYRNNYIIIKPRGQVWISAKSGFGEKMLVKSGLFTISCPVVPCKVRFVEETTCKVRTFLPQSWVLENDDQFQHCTWKNAGDKHQQNPLE